MAFIRFFLLITLLSWPALLGAQDAKSETWLKTATRAEQAVTNPQVSSNVLKQLRREISNWQDTFKAEKASNEPQLDTLNAQLKALGPPPAKGSNEALGLAMLRADLNTKIKTLQTPQLIAAAAFVRAGAIIDNIDAALSKRQLNDLTKRTQTPLTPALWVASFNAISDSFSAIISNIEQSLGNPTAVRIAVVNAPYVGMLFLFAVLVFVLARRVNFGIEQRLKAYDNPPRRKVIRFVCSLAMLFVWYLAFSALAAGLAELNLFGLRLDNIFFEVDRIILPILIARWIAALMSPARGIVLKDIELSAGAKHRTDIYVQFIGWVLALDAVLSVLAGFDDYTREVNGVIQFVLAAGIVFCLLRLCQNLRLDVTDEAGSIAGLSMRSYNVLRQGIAVVAPVGLAFVAAGYIGAVKAFLYPLICSLALMVALIGAIYTIQNVFAWVNNKNKTPPSGGSLTQLLLQIAVGLISIPFFSLIWGANTNELAMLWARFLQGIQIGELVISPSAFIILITVFFVGYLITQLLKRSLANTILPKTKLGLGGRTAIVTGVGYVGIVISGLAAISVAGLNLSSLAIVAGALSIGIGFGLQNIMLNFVSGIILLIERPIDEGDWIEVGGTMGYVRKISVRSTRIETFERTDVIVPNADLVSGTVTNYTYGNTIGRAILPVGVAYGTDTRKVEDILRDVASTHPMVLKNPPPGVIFKGFGADSLDFEVRVILSDVGSILSVKSDLNHQILEKFTQAGIEIPFAQRDVWIRNVDKLKPQE